MHPNDLEDPDDDEPPVDILDLAASEPEEDTDWPVAGYGPRPEIEIELKTWDDIQGVARQSALRDVIAGTRATAPEVLIRLCCMAHEQADRATLCLAFEAFAKTATPLLLSQAWGLSPSDRQDQVQEILLNTFAAIQKKKAEFAANWFAAFAKRRAISLYRKCQARFEGVNERNEPTEDNDPLDEIPARIPSAEARAMLGAALRKLPAKQRAAFIQLHLLRMKQTEIATHHNVSVRTVHSWLKAAEGAVGLTGDNNDR